MKLINETKNFEIATTPMELRELALQLERKATTLALISVFKLQSDGVSSYPCFALTFTYTPNGTEEIAQLKASYDRFFPPDEDEDA